MSTVNRPERKLRGEDINMKTLKIDSLDLSGNVTVLNVDTIQKLSELCKRNDCVFETQREFFLLKDGLAFRAVKDDGKPKTLTCTEIYLNPDFWSVKVVMTPEQLLRFAVQNNVTVFETETEYIVPSDIFLTAKKTTEPKLALK